MIHDKPPLRPLLDLDVVLVTLVNEYLLGLPQLRLERGFTSGTLQLRVHANLFHLSDFGDEALSSMGMKNLAPLWNA